MCAPETEGREGGREGKNLEELVLFFHCVGPSDQTWSGLSASSFTYETDRASLGRYGWGGKNLAYFSCFAVHNCLDLLIIPQINKKPTKSLFVHRHVFHIYCYQTHKFNVSSVCKWVCGGSLYIDEQMHL